MSAGAANAATTPGHEAPYASALFNYEISDSARDSDNGLGYQVNLGAPLSRFGLTNSGIEVNYFGTRRTRHIDGKYDYQNAVFLDYVYNFGLFGWGGGSFLPDFMPYVLGGAGAVFDDVRGHNGVHPGVDVGGGVLFPLPFMGWGVRTDFHVIGQQNHRSVPSSDFLFDYHLGIGLQIPLDFLGGHGEAASPPAPECPVKVVNPETGRSDCANDSDHDGIADTLDKCPDTPPGVKVDETGCPAGKPQDSDGDGVLDSADKCPDTPPGIKVDADGCPVSQVAMFNSVQFKSSSAQLTDGAKMRLDQVARAINEQANLRVEIGGYTDNSGSKVFNQKLSEQRAESVRQYLIAKGVDPGRLVAHGYGSSQPVASNDTETGRAANRRVEFKIIVQ